MAAVTLLGCLIYFPAKPKVAPSKSADADRMEFFAGLKKLVTYSDFWLLGLSCVAPRSPFHA
jgi:hypothetical protein